MKILIVHNFYRIKSGEDIAIEKERKILESFGNSTILYERKNCEIDNFTFFQKILFPFNTFFSFKTYWEVRKIVKKEKPNVTLVQNVFPLISPSVYYAFKKEKLPVVQRIYNYRFVCPNGVLYSKGEICERCVKGNYFHCILRKCYRQSYILSFIYALTLWIHRFLKTFINNIDFFVVPDEFLKSKLFFIKGMRNKKIRKVLNPFDIGEYESNYSFEKYFVYLGRLEPEKGVRTLLKTMREIKSADLIIVGIGSLQKELKRYMENNNLNNIKFLGSKYGNKLRDILRKSMFIVVPSEWYDNLPMVICQAFAIGKPIIASDINGIPEIVINNENGLLFDPGNSKDLAEKINYLISNPEVIIKFSKNAREKAEELFNCEKHYQNLARVFREVLNG